VYDSLVSTKTVKEHNTELTAFNGKKTFWRIKWEDAQIAFARDGHVASGSVEQSSIGIYLEGHMDGVDGILEFAMQNEICIRYPE